MTRQKFVVLSNPDKSYHESWHPGRSLLNIPHPFRALITGPPNAGKTLSVLNLLAHQSPPFEAVFLMHPRFFDYTPDPAEERKNENIIVTKEEAEVPEYKYVEYVGFKYLPSTSFFENEQSIHLKKVLIIDDIDLKQYCKDRIKKQRLNKLLSYSSTHNNVTVLICAQDVYQQMCPVVYRFSNFYSIYKFDDGNVKRLLAHNIGVDQKVFFALMKLLKEKHDNCQIDHTDDTPAPYRINYTIKVNIEETPLGNITATPVKSKENIRINSRKRMLFNTTKMTKILSNKKRRIH